MIRFICKCATAIVTCVILFTFIDLTILLSLTPYTKKRVAESHEVNVLLSIDKLKEKESSRIILVGGSNVALGVNSELIEEEFGRLIINTAVSAALGLEYQINSIKRHLKDGDIVIVSPEYHQFYGDLYGNAYGMLMFSGINYSKIIYDLPSHYLWYMRILPSCICDTYKRMCQYANKKVAEDRGAYVRSALNKYGDCILNREENKIYNGVDGRLNIEDFDHRAVRFLTEFSQSCIDSNIELVLLPPVYQESSYIKNEDAINLVDIALKDADIPFYSSPQKYCFDDSLFYDSPYHLNDKGIPIRTRYIIDDIRHLIKD
ncbi:MAG: hypothetical protein SNH41_02020 [Rikenellaceae bacterium]